jgi:large conductance mechanosensitive channel
MKNIIEEFKKFALKGNVVDLAVGVVIGAAFGKIVSSLVADIINPLIGVISGGIDFSDKVWIIKTATETAGAVTLNYGIFVSSVIDFFIVSLAIFFVIKQMNKLTKKEEESPVEKPAKISKEEELLSEIRDILKSGK